MRPIIIIRCRVSVSFETRWKFCKSCNREQLIFHPPRYVCSLITANHMIPTSIASSQSARISGFAYDEGEERWRLPMNGVAKCLIVENVTIPKWSWLATEARKFHWRRWEIPQQFISSAWAAPLDGRWKSGWRIIPIREQRFIQLPVAPSVHPSIHHPSPYQSHLVSISASQSNSPKLSKHISRNWKH